MPAGTQISGEDGIVNLLDPSDDSVIGEVPCLVSWTLNTTADVQEISTRCMKSNSDGGSDSAVGWSKKKVQGKTWNVSLTFFYQEDQLIPGSVQLDPTMIGERVKVQLYPNDDAIGKVVYEGTAIIASGDVSGDIGSTDGVQTTVPLEGDGELTKAVVV